MWEEEIILLYKKLYLIISEYFPKFKEVKLQIERAQHSNFTVSLMVLWGGLGSAAWFSCAGRALMELQSDES